MIKKVLDFILHAEMSNDRDVFLYLEDGLWKAYAHSARNLSAKVEKDFYLVESSFCHDMEIEILALTSESLIDSGLINYCSLLEDYRLMLEF